MSYQTSSLPLATTRTLQFLGLTSSPQNAAEGGLWNESSFGRGVIVGLLDTGILPNHPSFNDDGMPPPPAKWKGKCEFNKTTDCNNKLIGARSLLIGLKAMKKDQLVVEEVETHRHDWARYPYGEHGCGSGRRSGRAVPSRSVVRPFPSTSIPSPSARLRRSRRAYSSAWLRGTEDHLTALCPTKRRGCWTVGAADGSGDSDHGQAMERNTKENHYTKQAPAILIQGLCPDLPRATGNYNTTQYFNHPLNDVDEGEDCRLQQRWRHGTGAARELVKSAGGAGMILRPSQDDGYTPTTTRTPSCIARRFCGRDEDQSLTSSPRRSPQQP
ncbi:hypothetical protein HPP92_013975 [Vanilla planifolia]|uniref:Peptidase S8/S53 domain-containing protein n=1 Tax=Vanilla planifolia TaxID=51239 RepID=A0A835QKI5_VANPL|nr:hypothetical protein HPP92_013975 [Vanilla planifolia]